MEKPCYIILQNLTMLRPRIIPSLLVHENGLVKQSILKPKICWNPINAIKIFNEKEVDNCNFDI
jgi:cyclase